MFTLVAWVSLGILSESPPFFDIISRGDDSVGCPQTDPLTPKRNEDIWDALSETYGSDEFKNRAIDWLGGAVRVP